MSRMPRRLPEKSLATIPEIPLRDPAAPLAVGSGWIAVQLGSDSQEVTFRSGAKGYTQAQVRLRGDTLSRPYTGKLGAWTEVSLPERPGNILVIPHNSLVDTRVELMGDQYRVPFGYALGAMAILQSLPDKVIGGVRYDACITPFYNHLTNSQDIMYAVAGELGPLALRVSSPE